MPLSHKRKIHASPITHLVAWAQPCLSCRIEFPPCREDEGFSLITVA